MDVDDNDWLAGTFYEGHGWIYPVINHISLHVVGGCQLDSSRRVLGMEIRSAASNPPEAETAKVPLARCGAVLCAPVDHPGV